MSLFADWLWNGIDSAVDHSCACRVGKAKAVCSQGLKSACLKRVLEDGLFVWPIRVDHEIEALLSEPFCLGARNSGFVGFAVDELQLKEVDLAEELAEDVPSTKAVLKPCAGGSGLLHMLLWLDVWTFVENIMSK